VQRLLHDHASVCPGQCHPTRCPIASDQERLHTVAASRLDHRCDRVIARQGPPSRLAAAILLQEPSTNQ
jgi:hypothetical protein